MLKDPVIRSLYLAMSKEEQELFDERVGILHYYFKMDECEAEAKVFEEIRKKRSAKLESED